MRSRLKLVARVFAAMGAALVGGVALVVVLLALFEQASPHHSVADAKTRVPCAGAPVMEADDFAPVGANEAEATLCSLDPIRAIPASYLGISTEYWSVPLFEVQPALFARVLSLLRVPGDGPLIVRIGGDSSQRTFWVTSPRDVPGWAYLVTPRWFAEVRQVVKRSGARLILDLNMITATPADDVGLVRAAERRLPRGSIIGFEIGNESDLYARAFWRRTVEHPWAYAAAAPLAITAGDYAQAFRSYALAVRSVAPSAPLLGPAVGHAVISANWIRELLAYPHPGLETVSGHWYPYSRCARRGGPAYPSIAKLLDGNAAAKTARALAPVIRLVHRRGLRFRLTELNSVTCGGLAGVSNTFATALWTPDAMFQLLRAGVDGINVHVREDAINQAFALRNYGLQVRPLLYGLLLFDRTLGPDAQLVHVHLSVPRGSHLDVWGVRVGRDVMHVLAIDKGSRTMHLDLQVRGTGDATVQRLEAPSPGARSGVTLDGQWLGVDARWHGRAAHEAVRLGADGYEVTVPRYSAALVTMRLRPNRY